ncbi:unnamed protein product [Acanthoscelides obtectus]|uniref:Acyl-coenzyme A thioesterase 13 n=1 Tax=Acanthoscelides obtectus TaxID=200917 RepID=A0A9P0PTD6_ACAOB|nr:unnamed protein product [Acanthoscelides obtectus]CAK1663891.1 Acyl-coenzyme A thioesterase 13 [Acanthoscelides obtectus]
MTLTVNHLMNTLKNSHKFDRVMKDIVLKVLKEGKCVAEMKVGEEHTNPIGGLHGGCSATLVDNISSYALLSHGKGAVASVSVDMHMTYMKGAVVGDTIKIDARTLRVGKTLAFLEVDITNRETGDLLVKGT